MLNSLSNKLNPLDILAKFYDHSFARFFEHYESSFLDSKAHFKAQYQPVFIIGPPRTGSTILYQLITYYLNVNYIDNFVHVFNKHLLSGFHWSQKIFKNKPHNSFSSKFGHTSMSGWRAPSECAMFWYRLLPKTFHYIPKGYMPQNVIDYYRKKIFSVIYHSPKPFLFKNLNAGQRLGLIYEIAPNARFIFIRRDPVDTCLSILKARKANRIKPGEWWSVKPVNFNELMHLPEEEMVVNQVYNLEKQIINDKKYFPENNFLEIKYKELCDHPLEIMNDIKDFLGPSVQIRNDIDLDNLKIKKPETQNHKKVKERISQIVNQYHWP